MTIHKAHLHDQGRTSMPGVAHLVVVGLGWGCVLFAALHLLLGSALYRRQRHVSNMHKKAVLVTGCDSGFGNRLARRLAHMGFRVSYKVYAGCLFPDAEAAEALVRDTNIRVLKLDVTKQEDVDDCVLKVQQDLHENDDMAFWSVVNNAGIGHYGDFEFMSTSQFRRTFEVNSLGPVMITKKFLPLLREAGEGRVVNVASMAGRVTLPGFIAYCMSKHAVVALSDGLRCELRPWNISVHSIEPGFYRTSIVDKLLNQNENEKLWECASESLRSSYGEAYVKNRFISSEEYVAKILRGSDRICEVIDDLVHAVAAHQPKARYMPHWLTKLSYFLCCVCPSELVDFMACPPLTVKPGCA
ncbi:short-chain dehydrogenase/reductase family 9C member 7 [Hyalella azteca]|uniref:Short-chain dehydrogenase/reductase family 9C member 7 n=1 Tax=Hyalella azteca TaxID=294128 RepID=A0A8B7MXW8_HYAAZ|nr:short-chain dehydrogenase/reductase family 9C member 7 [Hyalella azteca]